MKQHVSSFSLSRYLGNRFSSQEGSAGATQQYAKRITGSRVSSSTSMRVDFFGVAYSALVETPDYRSETGRLIKYLDNMVKYKLWLERLLIKT